MKVDNVVCIANRMQNNGKLCNYNIKERTKVINHSIVIKYSAKYINGNYSTKFIRHNYLNFIRF